jgi:hypothetical protein
MGIKSHDVVFILIRHPSFQSYLTKVTVDLIYFKKSISYKKYFLYLLEYKTDNKQLKTHIMAKSQDAKKTAKKEPLKTAKEKKEEKREKKNSPKRD